MKKLKVVLGAVGICGLGAAVLSLPVSNRAEQRNVLEAPVTQRLNLTGYSSAAPDRPIDVLFIHHSCGGQLLAAAGESAGTNCVYLAHPNGGGLRARLEQAAYRLHEASYGSRIAEKTDVFDWLPKFRNQMDEILRCDMQDTQLPHGRRNQVVMFKSCFPNNAFRREGDSPGNSQGPELTVWNAKATYTALLEEFRRQPDVLFVCLTAPPMAAGKKSLPLWRKVAREAKAKLTGKRFDLPESGRLARQFNHWLADTNGWLKDYPLRNVVVFDYYDILTDGGKSNLSQYPTWGGADSHPSREGNEKAALAFVPFLNQAVRRADLVQGKNLTSN